ncbi:MAG: aminopeptidase [Ruminococcus sp.]|nr:aminopeptidase [Ruminococcus sp.]
MKNTKETIKEMKEKLFLKKKHALYNMTDEQLAECDSFCEDYKKFMDAAKIEREAVIYSIDFLKENGYVEYKKGMKLNPGDKIYSNNRGKAVMIAVIGTAPISDGVRLCVAHIDSPRLDLKQNPLYEDKELALFKTHYYGGIKKYQWTAIPLALHGMICKADGTEVSVSIGEDEGDPVFCITDLLPHLANAQMAKPLARGITGEQLNILIGSRPFKDDEESGAVKLNIMNILYEKYGITEADFISSELEAVPAFKAKDIGFDRSMIGAYGHDDKVCAYTALRATVECNNPVHTVVTVLTDKEETGSDGNTGLCSSYLEYFIYDLAEALGSDGRTVLSASECLSADVNAAFDPTFPEVNERNNCSYINKGVVITKYTGSRGKSGTSDASAEYTGKIRRLMNENNVIWQTGELGKVDEGGGGTVASYIANLNIDTIDLGVPVLSMHAPYEIVSKIDTYMAYKAFSVFIND